MKCINCAYYYKDEYNYNDQYPQCHFESASCWDIPPCEQEEIDNRNERDRREYEEFLAQIYREEEEEEISEAKEAIAAFMANEYVPFKVEDYDIDALRLMFTTRYYAPECTAFRKDVWYDVVDVYTAYLNRKVKEEK